MKKTKILFILVLGILLLGLGYQVYGKYVLSKKVSISFNTSDYYFEPSININATKTLPVTVDVTVKNHNGTDYTDKDLSYALRVSDGYTLTVVDGVNQRKLTGGQKSEETFRVTIDKTGEQKNENVHIYFDITKPYTTTESTKIAYQDVYDYDYTGNYEEFIALATGTYKIECWGAQGGTQGVISVGGNGAYTSGEIELKENDKLYVFVGENPGDETKESFNGGSIGSASTDAGGNESGTRAGSGGGASDVRLYIDENGIWNDFDSLKSRIMVAGAGGGNSNYGETANGGYGGDLKGGDGDKSPCYQSSVLNDKVISVPGGGTQTSGGTKCESIDNAFDGLEFISNTNGFFGKGGLSSWYQGVFCAGGAGGGYYGGGGAHGAPSIITSGAGGSSFISGHSGCDAIAESSTEANIVHTGQANHYSDYVFTNTNMIAGNANMPTHNGTSTMVGNTGNGYVKITFLLDDIPDDTTSSSTQVAITTTKNDEQTATINATATDNGAGIKKYDFYINNELKHTATTSNLTASYSFDYASIFGTTYDTYVIVTDNNNATNKSNTSTIIDYTVSDKQDMELFGNSVNNGNAYENETIIQTASIDLEGSESNQWTPIGTEDTPFNGNFEGNGNNISGLYINQEKGFLGLFGIMEAGSIKSLTVEGTITATSGEADTVIGGIISRNLGANIDSCTNKVNIIGVARIGGIAGKNEAGSITNCTNEANIEVNDMANSKWIGGIAGVGYGQIDSCVNEGNIVGNNSGGIVGISNNGAAIVSNCINNGEIKGNLVGGIQYYSDSTINNCINNGDVIAYEVTSGATVRVAGIVSILEGNMEQCANKGEIKADWNETNVGHIYVGGIVAEQRDGTRIAECYNEGNVIGNTKNSDPEVVSATYPGGIVSFSNGGTIINCYNKGSVSAYKLSGDNTNNAGGIICLTNSESTNVESCYNIGPVTATRGDGAISYTGGVVGRIQVEGTISNCYYLEGTTAGGINGADVTGQAEVRTSAIMKTTGFKDLLGDAKWKIVQGVNSGYPILIWQQDEPEKFVLADVVSVGDYVNYDANSNGTYTFTSSDCLTGTSIQAGINNSASATISTENKFNSEEQAQWRVLSVDKENGKVEIMSVASTTEAINIIGNDGFVNAETVLNNVGAIYGHGKGAIAGRSIAIEDIEQYSTYDKTKFPNNYTNTGYYGGTRSFQSGYFYEEIKDEERKCNRI